MLVPEANSSLCYAMVSQEYTYAYAAVSVSDGRMDSLILPYVKGDCMQVFLDEVAARHVNERIVMVLDGAGWHKKETLVVPDNIRLVSLPPYAPELNPVEHVWDELREKAFHNCVFDSIASLEDCLEDALYGMEQDHDRVRSIVAWPWIVNFIQSVLQPEIRNFQRRICE
jgi:hypothetical protein